MRATILLAAGGSRRFGRGDKLLACLHGRTLLDHALDSALGNGVGRVLAVVPSAGGRVARHVRRRADPRLSVVVARDHSKGMGASLAAGFARMRPFEREMLVHLADMPAARAFPHMRLIAGRDAVRPVVDGVPGHPMLVRAAAVRTLGIGTGDRGLAGRLDPARVHFVRGRSGAVLDVDTRAALRRARLQQGFRRCWR